MDLDALIDVLPRALILILVLVVVARPLAVWLSTIGAGLQRNDRQFLAWMAPRGIVAASVATVFSQTLIDEGAGPVPELVPIVFATVIVTVALYGLTAIPVARATRVAKTEPNGIALVSNRRFVVELADELGRQEVPVLVISTSTETQREAFSKGLLAYDRPIDSHDLDLTLDGVGIKWALLMTDDDNFASHAAHHLIEHLGRANLYQVAPDEVEDFEMRGRRAFGGLTFHQLSEAARAGGFHSVKAAEMQDNDVALFEVHGPTRISILGDEIPDADDEVIVVTSRVEQMRRATDRP